MSDFLQKLKGVFVVPDGNETTKKAAPKPEKASPPSAASTPTVKTTPTAAGSPSEKYTDLLFQAMEQNNQQGFDYIEYKKSLQALEKMPMDERTRYFSAFAAAQAMGLTKQKLIDSANFYLKVLQSEENKFEEATQTQRTRQIGDKEKAIAALENTIQEKREMIAKLNQEIQENQAQADAMKSEIQDAVQKIDTTRQDFQASYTNLEEQINNDIAKMNDYIEE